MNADLTEIICILDRSGSMAGIRSDAIGGFNTFLAEQQKLPGEARLTLVLFNHEYQRTLDAAPLSEVQPLTEATYVPDGMTALLDAVGRTIDEVGKRLADTPEAERPGAVLICILTDGLENRSSDYSREKVREMIEHQQEKYGWTFVFLAANQDAFDEARKLGIRKEDAVNYDATADGVREAYDVMSVRASDSRRRRT